ncbi:MAG: hypothetical protein QXJ32_04935 [Thermoplasmata archaeon]
MTNHTDSKEVRPTPDETGEACVHWSEASKQAIRTAGIKVAGVLILVAGFMGVTHSTLSLSPEFGGDFLDAYEAWIPPGAFLDSLMADHSLYAGLVFVFGVGAVACSMFALRITSFRGAVLGGVLGILAVGFLLGAAFSLLALILLVVYKKEFLLACG